MDKWTNDFLQGILNVIMFALPDSPFSDVQLPTGIQNLLPNINWVIPFGAIVNTIYLWVGCIAVYYTYQMILRWINAVS